jgi:hypothetical protein
LPFYEVSLVPKDLIIEAEDDDDLKAITKRITIEKVIWSTTKMNKDRFKDEMRSRYVYLKEQ